MMYSMRTALLSSCLLAASCMAVAEETTFKKPRYVHGLDTPVFTIVEKTADYEVRQYSPSKWVSTTIEGFHFVEAQRQGFMRLFDYISGDNTEGKHVPMTAPVRTLVTPGEGPFCATKFTVSFFVPYDYTDSTPKPSSGAVFVEETPAMTTYVTSFGGYMKESDIISRASSLMQKLAAKGIDVETETYYAAGYDSPFRLVLRHNEIWIIGKPTTPIV